MLEKSYNNFVLNFKKHNKSRLLTITYVRNKLVRRNAPITVYTKHETTFLCSTINCNLITIYLIQEIYVSKQLCGTIKNYAHNKRVTLIVKVLNC